MITVDKENGTLTIVLDLVYVKSLFKNTNWKEGQTPTDAEYTELLEYLAKGYTSIGVRIKAMQYFRNRFALHSSCFDNPYMNLKEKI